MTNKQYERAIHQRRELELEQELRAIRAVEARHRAIQAEEKRVRKGKTGQP